MRSRIKRSLHDAFEHEDQYPTPSSVVSNAMLIKHRALTIDIMNLNMDLTSKRHKSQHARTDDIDDDNHLSGSGTISESSVSPTLTTRSDSSTVQSTSPPMLDGSTATTVTPSTTVLTCDNTYTPMIGDRDTVTVCSVQNTAAVTPEIHASSCAIMMTTKSHRGNDNTPGVTALMLLAQQVRMIESPDTQHIRSTIADRLEECTVDDVLCTLAHINCATVDDINTVQEFATYLVAHNIASIPSDWYDITIGVFDIDTHIGSWWMWAERHQATHPTRSSTAFGNNLLYNIGLSAEWFVQRPAVFPMRHYSWFWLESVKICSRRKLAALAVIPINTLKQNPRCLRDALIGCDYQCARYLIKVGVALTSSCTKWIIESFMRPNRLVDGSELIQREHRLKTLQLIIDYCPKMLYMHAEQLLEPKRYSPTFLMDHYSLIRACINHYSTRSSSHQLTAP